MSHDGEDYTQIAFLRSDIDDSTGEYTERFEAGSFDMPAADALRFDLAVDLMDYFSGRTFEGEPGVSRGLEPREAVAAVEGATGCDLNFFEDFWLGSPGEIVESVHVGPYTKQSLLDFSYYAKELSRRYGFADSDILEIARHLPEECPDRFAAVKAYLDCEYVPDGDAPDEKTYRWGDFLEIAGGVTLNDVPSFGFDDGWDGSCLNRLDWFEDAAGMDADGLSAGLVANDAESIKALIGNCPAWIECFPSYSEKAAKGVDDAVQAVKAYRLEGKRVHREVIPGYLYETAKAAAAKTAGGADGGTGPHI